MIYEDGKPYPTALQSPMITYTTTSMTDYYMINPWENRLSSDALFYLRGFWDSDSGIT